MRIAIVGLGRAGAVHLAAATRGEAFRITAVCDPAATARAAGEAAGCRSYARLADMLEHEALEGAIVCTPPADHAPSAQACLDRSLHVLCEKPLTLGLTEAQRMFAAAKRAGRRVMVASKFRHVPAMRRARRLLRSGAIGRPLSFELIFSAVSDMSDRWHARPACSGGGVICDNGPHAFDLLAYLFGPVARVQANELQMRQRLPVEDSAALRIEVGGVIGRVRLSWNDRPPDDRYLVIHGARGTIEIGWQQARWRRDGAWRAIDAPPYDKLAAHRLMHDRFVAHVERGAAPWIDALDCLRSVAAVSAAYRSAASASWQAVDLRRRPAAAPLALGQRAATSATAAGARGGA
jgi:predicted dehydrogenase